MELFFLKLVAVVRALASIEDARALFDVLGASAFAVVVGAMFVKLSVQKSLRLGAIDGAILAFVFWCIATYFIYYEAANVKELAKMTVPLLTYTAVKNVVSDRYEYQRLVTWVVVGLGIPAVISAALIVLGSEKALHYISYWTGITRWKGVYEGAHNLGHSMTLLLMAIAVSMVLQRQVGRARGAVTSTLFGSKAFAALGGIAVYCLYMSQVRSALLGLLTFAAVSCYWYSRRLLVLAAAGLGVLGILAAPLWVPALVPEVAVQERGVEVDSMDWGSGRPRFWLNDIEVFLQLPFDQKLAGTGIGNRKELVIDGELKGHNDWLELLTQTGIVGLILFASIQVLIFMKIRKMEGVERGLYLALYASVLAMMTVSNSYVWRIQVSQLYYMMLAFIEIPAKRTAPQLAGMHEAPPVRC